MWRDLVAKVARLAGIRWLHQLVQLADLGLQQVDLLLLPEEGAIEFFQVILAETQLDLELRDSGFHGDSSSSNSGGRRMGALR